MRRARPVTVEYDGATYRGASVSTNIVEAGVRAFLEVINRIELVAAGAATVSQCQRRWP